MTRRVRKRAATASRKSAPPARRAGAKSEKAKSERAKTKDAKATHAQTLKRERTRAAFTALVNLSPAELRKWLTTEQSKSVGFVRPGESVSVGVQSGRAILAIKAKRQDALTPADYAHMAKVIGFIARHRAQRPRGDAAHSRWRYALMNWGHDPLQEDYDR